MASEGMHRLNVTILDGDDELTHWVGTPSQEGGALRGIDMSPTGGPPTWDYDEDDEDREQMKFTVETKILGTTDAEREAFRVKYKRGTKFLGSKISGMPPGLDWVVENASLKHSAEGNSPSTLTLTLAEIGPSEAANP